MMLHFLNVVLELLGFRLLLFARQSRFRVQRRPRSDPNDGWVDWPALGKGWKRKEVVRRSGSSVGQKDVYYMR